MLVFLLSGVCCPMYSCISLLAVSSLRLGFLGSSECLLICFRRIPFGGLSLAQYLPMFLMRPLFLLSGFCGSVPGSVLETKIPSSYLCSCRVQGTINQQASTRNACDRACYMCGKGVLRRTLHLFIHISRIGCDRRGGDGRALMCAGLG